MATYPKLGSVMNSCTKLGPTSFVMSGRWPLESRGLCIDEIINSRNAFQICCPYRRVLSALLFRCTRFG
ncbi:hypothetical protein HOE425_333335 [Hoeflea sp. EC-HK425]|nr:hypothetical protein HOE425_333335 [Hoeflea sp. EC-HK425]